MLNVENVFVEDVLYGRLPLEARNDYGQTALMIAILHENVAYVHAFLNRGANILLKSNICDTSPLMMAVSHVDCTLTQMLLWNMEQKALDDGVAMMSIDDADADGDTALMMAASKGHKENVALLIDYGANVNLRNKEGHTALWQAVENNAVSVVTYLLRHGACVDTPDLSGNTPLMCAATFGYKQILRVLLAYGANPSLCNDKGEATAELALAASHATIAAILHEKALSMDFEKRLSAIHYAGEIPGEYICSISLSILKDPVTVSSGKTYDRKSLHDYFAQKGNPEKLPCPLTRYVLSIEELMKPTDILLKKQIEEFVAYEENLCKKKCTSLRNKSAFFQPVPDIFEDRKSSSGLSYTPHIRT